MVSSVTAILGEETVKKHLQNIYGKLNARGRVGALNAARTLGLLSHTTHNGEK